mgnify:CR=1 FL=1
MNHDIFDLGISILNGQSDIFMVVHEFIYDF